jgi:hypothetical protein
MLAFTDCTLKQLDKTFSLNPLSIIPVLQSWLEGQADVQAEERSYLLRLQHYLRENVDNWNEQELAMHFIGPMFALVEFNYQRQFNLFAERPFSGVVDGVELGGKPDGLIATGYREPDKPYFCFQEYKRDKDPDGDPQAQVLAAMLVAQEINENCFPIYGCYVRGRLWFFMALQGKDYATSDGYAATKNEVFDILRILKVLKQMLIERVSNF